MSVSTSHSFRLARHASERLKERSPVSETDIFSLLEAGIDLRRKGFDEVIESAISPRATSRRRSEMGAIRRETHFFDKMDLLQILEQQEASDCSTEKSFGNNGRQSEHDPQPVQTDAALSDR